MLGDRSSPKEWNENGKPDLIANAIKRKNELLANASKAGFDPLTDAALREQFNIHLPRQH